MATTPEPAIGATLDFLHHLLAPGAAEQVGIQLWNGARWPDDRPRAATLVLKHPGALREMLADGTAKGLAEAYLRDDFDVAGDMEQAVNFATALERRPAGWLDSLAGFYRLQRLPVRRGGRLDGRPLLRRQGSAHSLARDREVVSFHYDVSNDFYQLWLDERMVYSCAYFESPDVELAAAQAAKLLHLCRKLRLRPGQRLLDIGCGWGGLAIFAAQHFGVNVTGVTLSTNQAALAAERVRQAGLEEAVHIERRDYRDVQQADGFDAVVSVGMSEHVGRGNLAGYFGKVWSLLRPGGVFLNHAIGEGLAEDRFHGPSFVDEYVFPDGDIPPLPLVLGAAETAGFEVRDVENLREHYALTLRHWVRRLEANHERALAFVNEPTYRVWRLYMAGSAHGFDHGDIAIYQALLAKPGPGGHASLPLTRRDWYA